MKKIQATETQSATPAQPPLQEPLPRRSLLAIAGLGLVGLPPGWGLLAGCGGNSEAVRDSASLRLVNTSIGYAGLDLAVNGSAVNTGVAYGTAGGYSNVEATTLTTGISATSTASALSTVSRSLSKGAHYSLVAYGAAGALATRLITEDSAGVASGLSSLQVNNLAPDAGSLDVYLTGSTDALGVAVATVAAVAPGAAASTASVSAGTYRLRVTGAGKKADLRLDVQGLVLASTQVVSLLLSEGAGGVLVDSVLLPQQAAPTALGNSQARVRVVAAVSGAGLVTVQVAGTTLASAAVSPTIGDYGLVSAGAAVPVLLSVNGVAVAVAGQSLPAGGDYTLLVWGSAAAPQLTRLAEDNRFPAVATNAKLRLVNLTTGVATAMTLKANFAAVASALAPGQASAYAEVAASTTVRLDVSSASNAALSTMTGTTLVANTLYSVYLFGDAAAPVVDFRLER